MNRREFNVLATTGLVSAALHPATGSASFAAGGEPASPPAWPGGTYRRLLMDTHVPDWDPAFLALYNPVDYARTAAKADFQAVMQYANSHVGLCLWPTKIGQQHAALTPTWQHICLRTAMLSFGKPFLFRWKSYTLAHA